MGRKYILNAFDYPFEGYYIATQQCDTLIGCLFWFVVFSIKYDGVDVAKRK